MMPLYAEQYQFEYEYVQYKWPSWLHQQNEKQRIIWGWVLSTWLTACDVIR